MNIINLLREIKHFIYTLYIQRKYKYFFKHLADHNDTKGRILMYVGIPYMFLTPFEILFYHQLKIAGYEVDYYIYDESIEANELITKSIVDKNLKQKFWSGVVNRGIRFLNAAKVKYTPIIVDKDLGAIVDSTKDSLDEIFSFKIDGINIGEIVRNSVYRYYKSLSLGDDSVEVAKKFLHTALTNYFMVKKLHESNEYEYIICSHGIYSTWGPIVEYAKENHIDFICYDRAKTKGMININKNQVSPDWSIQEAWDRNKSHQLSDHEVKAVDDYLGERELQKNDVFSYNLSPREKNISDLRRKYDICDKAKVITFFTNLIWDAANVSRDIAFKSPLECICETVAKYANQSDVHILIRPHPAEIILGTNERYGNLVIGAFDKLPGNVTIIEPDEGINSFSMIDLTDIGVVHTSTIGIEAVIMGKPVILLSETHYRDKGFTYDAISDNHYFKLLEKLITNPKVDTHKINLAKKYFYFMMFEYQHKIPLKFGKSNSYKGYTYNNINQLLHNKEEPINRIIDRISDSDSFNDFIFR